MNFQEELSRNARDPREIEEEKQAAHRQEASEEARRMAALISGELERQLLKAVKNGEYTKEYNKGTVKVRYTIPQNRYLDVNSQSEYEYKTHRCIRTYYQFQPKSEYSLEYQQLRNYLNNWAMGQGIKLSWVVRAEYKNYKRSLDLVHHDLGFPSHHKIDFEGHIFPRFTLQITAVSHFAIDPNFSKDYKNPEDIRDMLLEEIEEKRARLPLLRETRDNKKSVSILFGVVAAMIAPVLAYSVFVSVGHAATSEPSAPLLFVFLGLVPWLTSRSHRRKYLEHQDELETILRELEEQEKVVSCFATDPQILIEYMDPTPAQEAQRRQREEIEQLRKNVKTAKWALDGNLEVTLFLVGLCVLSVAGLFISHDKEIVWGGAIWMIIAVICAIRTVSSYKNYRQAKKELAAALQAWKIQEEYSMDALQEE